MLITKGKDSTSAKETVKLMYLSIRRQKVKIINTFISNKKP
jgi:hypothetical protein